MRLDLGTALGSGGNRYASAADRSAARKKSKQKWAQTTAGRASLSRNNRKAALKRVGADDAEYDRLYKKQRGRCAICRTRKPNVRVIVTHFSVDHCHKTKKVRGLLCDRCNLVLGKVHDDPKILRAAAAYLEGHN